MSKSRYSLQMAVYDVLSGKEIIKENTEISGFLERVREAWVGVENGPSEKGPSEKGPDTRRRESWPVKTRPVKKWICK